MLSFTRPEAPRLLGQHLNTSVGSFQLVTIGDTIVSGTGYTGEKGCEIIGPLKEVVTHWEALIEMGAPEDTLDKIIKEAERKEKDANQILEFTREVKNKSFPSAENSF